MVLDGAEGTGPGRRRWWFRHWRSWSPTSPADSALNNVAKSDVSMLWHPDTQHRWPRLQDVAVQSHVQSKLSWLYPFKCLQGLNDPQVLSGRSSAVHAATF